MDGIRLVIGYTSGRFSEGKSVAKEAIIIEFIHKPKLLILNVVICILFDFN